MFEEKTYENIMDEMLDNIDNSVDTRQGSVIYDAISPVAMELEQVYSDIGLIGDECFADTASYYYLIKLAAERGIFVKEGSNAVLKIQITPDDLKIPMGTEFNIGEMNYVITEDFGKGTYAITCTESGTGGNSVTDDIIPLEDIEGLETVEFEGILAAGTDDEEEEALRERYFDSFKEVAFGGNRAEYKEKANEISSVGGCKVIPVWNGGGTVKIVILGADHQPAPASVIQEVQDLFDPTEDGTGVGLAPIGHVVTVVTAGETVVDINSQITFMDGYAWDDIKDTFRSMVMDYFCALCREWEDSEKLVVRTGQIESILLSIMGVDNVIEVKLNGNAGNLVIDEYNIPKVGEMSGTAVD